MNDIPTNAAALKRRIETEAGLLLQLRVQDPEVLSELNQREGAEREQYALTALRVGVIALRQAGGFLDVEKLRHQGQLILKDLERQLVEHTNKLDKGLSDELKRYFNPENGHLQERVADLVHKDGELAKRLQEYVSGDNSVLARHLAEAVGSASPLMTYLSPEQKGGLIERIAAVAESRLKEQSDRVLSEFDLNRDDSALNRLIRDVKKINSEIGEKFDAADENSVLSRLNKALEATREQIRKDLTLDDQHSSLSRLQEGLRKQLEGLAIKQIEFQNAVSEQLGIRQVQARTTEGGFGFEHQVAEAIQKRVSALGDEFQSVGETLGAQKRRTGDHLHTLGAESAAPGARIVYECKRDKSYRIKVALEELAEARKNRESEVGIFVMSAATLRDSPALRGEYPAALARFGTDIVAVWDCEDERTDVVLDAAIGVARALVVRSRKQGAGEDDEELDELGTAIADIEKQLERFEKMAGWCDDIAETAGDLAGKAEKMKVELVRVSKRLESDVRSLNEGLSGLRAGDEHSSG